MKQLELINELIDDLTVAAYEYKMGQIDKIELNLRLQLTISKIDKIEIDFTIMPLKKLVNKRHTKPFNQQLFKSKYKAIQSLITLVQTNQKNAFFTKLSYLIANKLYFNSLYRIIYNSCIAYISKNRLDYISEGMKVFIIPFDEIEKGMGS